MFFIILNLQFSLCLISQVKSNAVEEPKCLTHLPLCLIMNRSIGFLTTMKSPNWSREPFGRGFESRYWKLLYMAILFSVLFNHQKARFLFFRVFPHLNYQSIQRLHFCQSLLTKYNHSAINLLVYAVVSS